MKTARQHGAAIAIALFVLLSGCRKTAFSPGISSSASSAPVHARFEEVTQAAGLTFTPPAPRHTPLNTLELTGRGCGFLDYDGDGFLDILLVGNPHPMLYRNDGQGRFSEVTRQAGIQTEIEHGMGCAVADIDNNGRPDILLTGHGALILYRNDGNGRFTDVTAVSGLSPSPERWYTSAAFGDMDNDGFLDLYVACYAEFDPDNPRLCSQHGIPTACGPLDLVPQQGVLYQNRGGRRFEAVTKARGADATLGRGLGALFVDYNNDGRLDLALANDEAPGNLFQNQGGHFQDVALPVGVAYDVDGHVHGGMGIATADYDNDSRLDLLVTTYEQEATSLYRQEQAGFFQDVGFPSGVAAPTTPWVGFGCGFPDVDNDGRPDIFLVNGHIRDNAPQINPNSRYEQPLQLLWNKGDRTFTDISAQSGSAFAQNAVGRGAAFGDYDNDGKVDILVSDVAGKPLLLHNTTPSPGNWLRVHCVGTKANRDGIGAIITVTAGGHRYIGQVVGGGSYLSASDLRVHFGLGDAPIVDSIAVRWPGGRIEKRQHVAVNQSLTLREEQ